MSAVRAQEQKLKLAAYQSAQAKQAAAIERATKTYKLGEGEVLFDVQGREITKGAPKTRTAVPMVALMSGGKKLFFNQDTDPGGKTVIGAHVEDNPGETVVEIFKARPEPGPTAGHAAQIGFSVFDAMRNGDTIPLRTGTFNMAEPGAAKAAHEAALKEKGLTKEDMVRESLRTHKVAAESGDGKVSRSVLTAYGLDQNLTTRYGGKTLLADYKSASKAGKKSIRDQLGRYEAALHLQISPSFDKDLGKTVPATGLSAAGEQAVRDRLSLLEKLETWYNDKDLVKTEEVKAQYKSNKRLLAVSSRLKAHIARMDAASLAGSELKTMQGELQRLRDGEGIAGGVNRFLKEGGFDFRHIGGGLPGALSGWVSKIGAFFQQDLTPERSGALGAWKDLVKRTTRVVSQLDKVSPSESTRAHLIEIKELSPSPESVFTNKETLLRRAGEFRGVLESSLEDTLRKAGVAQQMGNPTSLAKHYDYARTLRKMLFSWAYVENSLRGGEPLNVPTSEAEKATLDKLKGKKGGGKN